MIGHTKFKVLLLRIYLSFSYFDFGTVGTGISLCQAIKQQLLSDVPELSSQKLAKFIRKNQKFCWVVLDGLDEFAGSMVTRTVVEDTCDIANAIMNKDLSNCRILVTTRPHLEDIFEKDELPCIYAKMEIEGFSTENSRLYFQKFFNYDAAAGNELVSYLNQNDVINELISTPLFCLMVCYLWRENFLRDVDTQTELFDNVNKFLWHHSRSRFPTLTEERLTKIVHKLGKGCP